MAQQHFYSRVPARMSVYNLTDSFDTFAFSDGLERDFIEKELSAIYDNKPSKNDAVMIRNGELPPVYCQFITKSGRLAQGCTSFLPLDYTQERSSYLVHTLIAEENEVQQILYDPDNAAFNPEMFKNDMSEFSLTSLDSKPDCEYPTIEYKNKKVEDYGSLSKYDSAMMKRLIYALLNLACGKGKAVFIVLPCPIASLSATALDFMNTILQIFPYNLRKYFSFVTYTDDPTRYSSFNIRFVPERVGEISSARGVTLRFNQKLVVGQSDETVAANAQIVEFFYTLMHNDAIRREFIYYMDNAVKRMPELEKMNLKSLTEMVFLFQQCSGFFNEKVIIPNDDRVYDYICAYEKRRGALSEEYRAIALKCLQRYPQSHQAIPKDVFAKLQRIYPGDTQASKHVVMTVVLDLIHTDVMRDKLFAFLKSNYSGEDAETKAVIVRDIARVYYGGFLQQQIINFFDEIFETEESKESRDEIVEKLLLTIRTEAVRKRIIEFFGKYYDILSPDQKEKLYATFYQMLPEGDALSEDIVAILNEKMPLESEEVRREVAEKLYMLAENNQKRKEPKLLPALLSKSGFCCEVITRYVFFERTENKIFDSYVGCYNSLEPARRNELLDEIWKIAPDMPNELAERWAVLLCEHANENPDPSADLYSYMSACDAMELHLKGSKAEKVFANRVLGDLLRPKLCRAIGDAFSYKRRRDGMSTLIEYAEKKPFVKEAEHYAYIESYLALENAIVGGDWQAAISAVESLPEKGIRPNAADQIKARILDTETLAGEDAEGKKRKSKLLAELLCGYMKTRDFDFSARYAPLCADFSAKAKEANPKISQSDADADAAKKAVELILFAGNSVYTSCVSEEKRASVVAGNGSLARVIGGFVANQKKGNKYLNGKLASGGYDKEFSDKLNEIIGKIEVPSESFFAKLFKKKK